MQNTMDSLNALESNQAPCAAAAPLGQPTPAPGPASQTDREPDNGHVHAADAAQQQAEEQGSVAAARQPAAGGDSGNRDVTIAKCSGGSDADSGEEDGEEDSELGAWLAGRLQRLQPDAELTEGSVRVLGRLLDEITARVLDEARRVNADANASVAGGPVATACGGGGSGAAAGGGQDVARRSKQAQALPKPSTLTSLDIHKALKRVLPGDPADGKLRPYLPAVTKQAWHLDKQSLKGIKRQKQATAAADSAAQAASKENEQQQTQAAAATALAAAVGTVAAADRPS